MFCLPLALKISSAPVVLKSAKVVPIYNANDKQDIENYYTPNSAVLSVFSKIMKNRFHCKAYILHKYQFRFRNQHSTNLVDYS